MLAANKELTINKIDGIKNGDELIKKYRKLSKLENCLSLKNWLSQKKNCQKVRIYLILILKRISQAF